MLVLSTIFVKHFRDFNLQTRLATMNAITICLVLVLAAVCQAQLPRRPDGKVDWTKVNFPKPDPFQLRGRPVFPLKNSNYINIQPRSTPIADEDKEDLSGICGRSNEASDDGLIDSIIVGGKTTKPHAYPWACGVYVNWSSFCSCTLISNKWILTAAHCASGYSNWYVYIGGHNLDLPIEEGRIEVSSRKAVVHPGWNTWTLENDLALIKIDEIQLSDNIGINCLPSRSLAEKQLDNQIVKPIGWGRPSDNVWTISSELREVDVEVLSNAACNSIFGIVQDTQICTKGDQKKGTCSGDSGSSVNIRTGSGTYAQVGIVSYGAAAGCEKGYPNGHTRVSSYLDWISNETGIKIQD